ncbi:AI-2E family transporter [Winogradskyella ursingii]|uniref:AI-2E family transporter n=1 Tax=Winogradskyella ursingii TaxID=2686079 RepID=UPI001C53C643|nr:AI-2E family transporter [Winogradskyella ursingii]
MIKASKLTKSNLQTLGIIIGICIVLFVLFKIRVLILFAFIAGVLALVCRPLVIFLKTKLKFSKTLASVVTLVVMISVVCLMLWIFLPIIVEQGKNISQINFDVVKQDLNELSLQASDYLGLEQINLFEAIKEAEFAQNLNSEFIDGVLDVFFDNIFNTLVGLFSVLFISFFLLKDDNLIPNMVIAFADIGKEKRFLLVLNKSKSLLTRYFIGLLCQMLVIAILYFILLYSLGIQNALAVALVCAFLNIVPYLGPLLGAMVIMLIVLSANLASDFSTQLLPDLITVLVGVSIIQLIDNFFSQPIIFGQSVKSHPLEIFIVIFMGGLLFGIPGMILAVPVYTTLKVISKEFLSEYKIVKQLTKDI